MFGIRIPPDTTVNAVPILRDVRLPFACILTLYAALGCTVLGFNRSPWQMVATVAASMAVEILLARLIRREWAVPISAYISGIGLSLLLNYAHNPWLLFPPVFLTIASKYIFTFKNRHFFNPTLVGVVGMLWCGQGMYASAPAYQWGGSFALMAFMVTAALTLFIFRVNRAPLVVAFLIFFGIQLSIRAYVVRWHIDPSTLWLGTFSSPSFYLFTFFMITDPKTSPDGKVAQVGWAFAIVVLDLWFHTKLSLSTFLFALFWLSLARGCWLHFGEWRRVGLPYLRLALFNRETGLRWLVILTLGSAGYLGYREYIRPGVALHPDFRLEAITSNVTGVDSRMSDLLNEVDPRIRHFSKWILSVGDAVAVADYDNDGLPDIFLTNTLKRPADRCALYRNLGSMRFERVKIPALEAAMLDPEKYGIPTFAAFGDYDNSGRQSLLIGMAYGKMVLLKNTLDRNGSTVFVDVSMRTGVAVHNTCVAATFLDYDRDGWPDLYVANSLTTHLPDYSPPVPLNIFNLPVAEHVDDRRMFHFMHESWNNARNGGKNILFRNNGDGTFTRMDAAAMGLTETGISLAVGTADFNHDGYTDLYVANDFGPDDLYLNQEGKFFRRVAGRTFGSIGKDTYKGMNVSIGDIANDGEQATYVSNVHVPLQAEGSLLWIAKPNANNRFIPDFTDEAAAQGALNEGGFGWGAAMGDLNLDGWLDIIQANGMVDDRADKRFQRTESYWYMAEKVMRSGPEVHSYVDRWPDLRGYDIFGKQPNRVYLSRGDRKLARFADVAVQVGLTDLTNSRGVALVDLENNGTLDVIITHQFESASFYRNLPKDTARRKWIGLDLRGDGIHESTDAYGTIVRATTLRDGRPLTQTREIRSVSGFSAQGDRRVLFGFAGDESPLSIEILWHGGGKTVLLNPEKNRYHRITHKPENDVP